MNCSSTNGRVDIMSPNTNLLFSMSDRMSVNKGSDFRDAMKLIKNIKKKCKKY